MQWLRMTWCAEFSQHLNLIKRPSCSPDQSDNCWRKCNPFNLCVAHALSQCILRS